MAPIPRSACRANRFASVADVGDRRQMKRRCAPVAESLEDRRLLAAGRVQFSPPLPVLFQGTPNSSVIADFNRDGKLDLAVAIGSHRIGVARGNGNGTFLPAQYFVANPSPFFPTTLAIRAGDVNNDGKPDIIVSTFSGNSIAALVNTSFGGGLSFNRPVLQGAGAEPVFVATGDFNRDGKLDVATANIASDASASVAILLGRGDGRFRSPQFVAAGANANSVAVADFNRDGIRDLAVTYAADTGPSANRVGILLGNGNGTFRPVRFFGVGTSPISLAVGDFNRDGRLDLASANANSNNVTILLGNGFGGFFTWATYFTGQTPLSVVAADFNADGRLDLAVENSKSNNVKVLLGRGNGTFNTSLSPFVAGIGPNGPMAVGRLAGRFVPDIAVPNAGGLASVLLNRTRLFR